MPEPALREDGHAEVVWHPRPDGGTLEGGRQEHMLDNIQGYHAIDFSPPATLSYSL